MQYFFIFLILSASMNKANSDEQLDFALKMLETEEVEGGRSKE